MRQRKTRGVSNDFEGNFFVPSPTANLVGINEEGHERFSARDCEVKCTFHNLFFYSEDTRVVFDKGTMNFWRFYCYESKSFLANSRMRQVSHRF